ncbi:MAG TPA: hypothetical protein VD908_01055 [Cytophagales bacterium]|nr:hypothetical protein [Cytophagales bacterium]
MKKLSCLILLMVVIISSLQSQGFDGMEYNGKIELASGDVVIGEVFYDASTGRVMLKNEKETEYYNARSASYFEFYDFERNTIRKFYSLLYSNHPTFFELLIEASNLALLSRENISSAKAIAYISKSADETTAYYSDNQSAATNRAKSETLFLADDKGNIEPYVVINRNKFGTSANYVSPYLLSYLTKGKYADIRRYAKENRYSLKNKDHLIELIDFYDELSKN